MSVAAATYLFAMVLLAGCGRSSVAVSTTSLSSSTSVPSTMEQIAVATPPVGPARANGQIDRDVLTQRWQRAHTATVVLEGSFTRTRGPQELIRQQVRIARRGSDFVDRRDGMVSAQLDNQSWSCSEMVGCFLSGPAPSPKVELNRVMSLVDGPSPTYALTVSPDCVDFVLQRASLVPPLGTRTQFCFDQTSGALVRRTTLRTIVVSRVVADSDLALPAS
jgi:hypothetical protein